nr:hypothetical protein [Tanacetum cinerariifolium]
NYDHWGNVICTGKDSLIRDGHKSFPSGHTSSGKLEVFDRRGHVAKLSHCRHILLSAVFPSTYHTEGWGPYAYFRALEEARSARRVDHPVDEMTNSVVNNSVFKGFFEKQKLTGPNFIHWYRQLTIVLSVKDKLNYLEHLIPAAPVQAHVGQQVAPEALAAYAAWVKGSKEIVGLTMLESLLQAGRRQSVSSYVLKMKSNIDNLERLWHPVTLGLGVSLILISLCKEFDGFVQNYNMHSMGKTINELHAMLKFHEQTLPKNNAHPLHAIQAGKVQKGNKKHKKPQPQLAARCQNQEKRKNKLAYAPKPKIFLRPRGKILLRTLCVINAVRHVIGRGTVLGI